MRYINVVAAPFAAIATSVLLASSGMAATVAPDVTGKKFSEAESALKTAGFKAVVSSSAGDKLQRSDCLVVSQRTMPANGAPYEVNPRPGFDNTRVALSLNCNPVPAKAKAR
jgi:beta-lactam-binding protein with PASTA domain